MKIVLYILFCLCLLQSGVAKTQHTTAQSFEKTMASLSQREDEAYKKIDSLKAQLNDNKTPNLDFLAGQNAELESRIEKTLQQLDALDAVVFDLKNGAANFEKLSQFPQKYLYATGENSAQKSGVCIDLSAGKFADEKPMSFAEKFERGGIWVYPIAFFAVLAFFAALYSAIRIYSVGGINGELVNALSESLKKGDLQSAQKAAKNLPKFYAKFACDLLESVSFGKDYVIEKAYALEFEGNSKLCSFLPIVSITASVAPLLGLLGTITGIIKTFSALSLYGGVNADMLGGGIGEALITTEFGLVLAIPSYIVFAVISRRAKTVSANMRQISAAFELYFNKKGN